jgi:Cu+-exporting ATPase
MSLAVPARHSAACHHGSAASLAIAAPVKQAAAMGLLASVALLVLYLGLLTQLSGREFTLEQFRSYWPFIITLAIGFGIQFGLFTYLRRAANGMHQGKVVAVTGTTSAAAMVSCCTHYLVNLLPVLGATGLMSFVGAYQIELFWAGLLANFAGIVYLGSRLRVVI